MKKNSSVCSAFRITTHGTKWKQLLPAIAHLMVDLGKNPPLENNFATIATPTQIMVGDTDNMVTIEESMRVYRSLPNAKLAVLPDTKASHG